MMGRPCTAATAGMRFHREGFRADQADLLRLVQMAALTEGPEDLYPLVTGPEITVRMPSAALRAIALRAETSPGCLVEMEDIRRLHAALLSRATAVPQILEANALWARAASAACSVEELASAAREHSAHCAVPTGIEEDVFVQEMLVTAGFERLVEGDLDAAASYVRHLMAAYPGTPARWFMLACRVADREVLAGRDEVTFNFANSPADAELSHDDDIDFAELAYHYGLPYGRDDLKQIRLSASDPFGLATHHVTPLRRRQSHRAYRLVRVSAALGLGEVSAELRERTQSGLAAAYLRAAEAIARLEASLWNKRPLLAGQATAAASLLVDYLRAVEAVTVTEPVALASGTELLGRLSATVHRRHTPEVEEAVWDALWTWLGRGGEPLTVAALETLGALARSQVFRRHLDAGPARTVMLRQQGFQEAPPGHRSVTTELRSLADGEPVLAEQVCDLLVAAGVLTGR